MTPPGKFEPTDIRAAPAVRLMAAAAETGVVAGYGSVYGVVDAYGTRVERGAFAESLKAAHEGKGWPAMLFYHDPAEVIGKWTAIEEDAYGLKVRGEINQATQRGREVTALLRSGALNGLSVGMGLDPDQMTKNRDGTVSINQAKLWEVSVVTFPANQDARVTDVKAIRSMRGFEGALREAGWPRAAAAKLAAGGWPALDPTEPDPEAATFLRDIKRAADEFRAIRSRR